jgi:hypothetical protein
MWISALVLWIGGTWLVGVLTSTTLLALGLSQLTTPIISIVSALYVGVILPVFANYLYYSSVGQRIAHLREKFVDDADALSALKSRSPVSWLALAVLALLVVGGRLLQPSLSRNQASESYVRAAMEQTTTLRTAVVKSYLSRHVWPEDLKDLSPQGEVLLSRQDAENLRIDLGTITIRFTTLDGLRGGAAQLPALAREYRCRGLDLWLPYPCRSRCAQGGGRPRLDQHRPQISATRVQKTFLGLELEPRTVALKGPTGTGEAQGNIHSSGRSSWSGWFWRLTSLRGSRRGFLR